MEIKSIEDTNANRSDLVIVHYFHWWNREEGSLCFRGSVFGTKPKILQEELKGKIYVEPVASRRRNESSFNALGVCGIPFNERVNVRHVIVDVK